jgi:hypothetical protein
METYRTCHHESPPMEATLRHYFRNIILPSWLRFLTKITDKLHEAEPFFRKHLSLVWPRNSPQIFVSRMFITAFTNARHWYQSWTTSVYSTFSLPVPLRSILILSSYTRLVLSCGLFHSPFRTKILYTFLSSPVCATRTAHLIPLGEEHTCYLHQRSYILEHCQSMFFPSFTHITYFSTPQHPILKTLSIRIFLKFHTGDGR